MKVFSKHAKYRALLSLLFCGAFAFSHADSEDGERRVYGRHVPERMDDFAWENDRVAFRMYGPALEESGEISSGIDVWSKSTSDLVIDKWYREGDYHTDHGEGADFYKVGPSRGCGGLAVWHQGGMHPSRNWSEYRVVEDSPDEIKFQLSYDSWNAGERSFTETKTISLRPGTNLNYLESTFSSDREGPFAVAIGVVLDENREGELTMDPERGVLAYWGPENEEYGNIGCGVVVDPDDVVDMLVREGHALVIVAAEPGEPLDYYAGACWSKSDYFPTSGEWEKYLRDFSRTVYY